MGKTKLLKIFRAMLGIATEVALTILLMVLAYGLSWLIFKGMG